MTTQNPIPREQIIAAARALKVQKLVAYFDVFMASVGFAVGDFAMLAETLRNMKPEIWKLHAEAAGCARRREPPSTDTRNAVIAEYASRSGRAAKHSTCQVA